MNRKADSLVMNEKGEIIDFPLNTGRKNPPKITREKSPHHIGEIINSPKES
jgi:hypothetical protein